MGSIKDYDAWKQEYPDPVEEKECSDNKCQDGVIHGIDANGSEVSEKCPNSAHWTEEEWQREKEDFLYEQHREGII